MEDLKQFFKEQIPKIKISKEKAPAWDLIECK